MLPRQWMVHFDLALPGEDSFGESEKKSLITRVRHEISDFSIMLMRYGTDFLSGTGFVLLCTQKKKSQSASQKDSGSSLKLERQEERRLERKKERHGLIAKLWAASELGNLNSRSVRKLDFRNSARHNEIEPL